MNKLLLIGGTNIDYIGTSFSKIKQNDSNIGTINISYGGVMRNVCENLARLGNKCIFFTAIGNDEYGKKIRNDLNELDVECIIPDSIYPTSAYLAINDYNHDMINAICDNRIIDDLNGKFLDKYKDIISQFEYIIIDSNLNDETLDYLFKTYKNAKFICEGISMNKIIRFKPYLKNIYLLKCNIYEAQELTETIHRDKELVKKIIESGVSNIIISAGSKNIYYGYNNQIDYVKVEEISKIKNTTGCGDALFSGIIDYLLDGNDIKNAIQFGIKLSALTLETNKATNEKVSNLKYIHKKM